MRTTQRDQAGGIITFGATVADAASGSGVAQPGGIPFTFTRQAAGTYYYRFSKVALLTALAVPASAGNNSAQAVIDPADPTFMQVTTVFAAAYTNLKHAFQVTAKVLAT